MTKRLKKIVKSRVFKVSVASISGVILIILIYNLYFIERIFPGISVVGVNIGGYSFEEAKEEISTRITYPSKITLDGNGQKFDLDLASLDFTYDFSETAKSAYEYDRTGNTPMDFYQRISSPFRKVNLGLRIKIDYQKLDEALSVIAGEVGEEAIPPSVISEKGEIKVDKGKAGIEVDIKKLRADIGHSLAFANYEPLAISTRFVNPALTDKEAEELKGRAEKLIGKILNIKFEFSTFPYKGNNILSFLSAKDYDQEKITEAVEKIAKDIDRDPANPTFVFTEGKVNEFAPAKEGIKTDKEKFSTQIFESLQKLETEDIKDVAIDVPVSRTPSEIQTADVNNLGIKELIGRGTSRFRGSIPSRVYNITLAASRLNGILIKPGETFSFNSVLGDVSKFTGYKEAFIIKDGKTVLGDGGGVCQVSSTFFRAALNAGLPIVERRAHAYRVSYYEQDSGPGLDATVYSPTTDLKIQNDTPGHILIQTTVNSKTSTLVFEFYGTNDGRVATTTKPRVSDVIPPPEDLYQDDPTLPVGKVKQIDFKAWGAKVRFDYKVERDGETIYSKKFLSNYRPWQAIFLRGTAPVQ